MALKHALESNKSKKEVLGVETEISNIRGPGQNAFTKVARRRSNSMIDIKLQNKSINTPLMKRNKIAFGSSSDRFKVPGSVTSLNGINRRQSVSLSESSNTSSDSRVSSGSRKRCIREIDLNGNNRGNSCVLEDGLAENIDITKLKEDVFKTERVVAQVQQKISDVEDIFGVKTTLLKEDFDELSSVKNKILKMLKNLELLGISTRIQEVDQNLKLNINNLEKRQDKIESEVLQIKSSIDRAENAALFWSIGFIILFLYIFVMVNS